jgi:glycosyltransferase involved in cell wall biosynthesis
MRLELAELIASEGLTDDFLMLGSSHDLRTAYSAMDLLAFPSHLDAPGRPVFEAAFFGVPSIVAVRQPKPDTIRDGETGIAIPHSSAELLADAIAYFAENPGEAERMGINARALAERNFSPRINAADLLQVYRNLVPGSAVLQRSAVTEAPEPSKHARL